MNSPKAPSPKLQAVAASRVERPSGDRLRSVSSALTDLTPLKHSRRLDPIGRLALEQEGESGPDQEAEARLFAALEQTLGIPMTDPAPKSGFFPKEPEPNR